MSYFGFVKTKTKKAMPLCSSRAKISDFLSSHERIAGALVAIKKTKLIKHDYLKEIKSLHKEYRESRNKTRKLLKKIELENKKLWFLDRIVKPREETDEKADDIELEIAVMDLFSSLGYKCEKPKSESDVDVIVKSKKYHYGIEVKNGGIVKENEMFQPIKHKALNDHSFHSILIYNNTKTNANWDYNRKKISEEFQFGILTTKELKKGFIKLKNKKITFEQFNNQLNKKGEIKFTKSEFEKAYKSETPRTEG